MKQAVIYSRTSSTGSKADRQDYTRQINDLKKYCKQNNLQVVEVIGEKVSGSTKNENRPGINRILQLAEAHKIDAVVCSELSRISRTPYEAQTLIEQLTELKVCLHVQNLNLRTLDDKGKRNPITDLIMAVVNQFSAVEKSFLVQRIKSGQEKARKEGKIIHRPKGSTESKEQFLSKHKAAAKDLAAGLSLNKTAKLHDISVPTCIKIRRAITKSVA